MKLSKSHIPQFRHGAHGLGAAGQRKPAASAPLPDSLSARAASAAPAAFAPPARMAGRPVDHGHRIVGRRGSAPPASVSQAVAGRSHRAVSPRVLCVAGLATSGVACGPPRREPEWPSPCHPRRCDWHGNRRPGRPRPPYKRENGSETN